MNKRNYVLLAACIAVFLALAIASARTNLPWSDEAWFATPALNLMTKGYPGVSLLDEKGEFHHMQPLRAQRRAYSQPPLHMLAQVVWYQLVGFSVFAMRYLSTLWGIVAIGSMYLMLKRLFPDLRIAIVAVVIMAIDFTVIWTSSEGRMDMMVAGLGLAAFASYLWLREKRLLLAVLCSQTLVAAAGLSHPMGFGYFVGLFVLTLYCDRSRIRLAHLGVACLPYLVGGIGWGWYIYQDPEAFWAQFAGNAYGRVATSPSILQILDRQLVHRYLSQFGFAADTRGFSHLKVVILFAYALGLLGVLLNRDLRRQAPYRILAILLAASLGTFMVLDSQDIHAFYLIHFVVFLIPMLAAWTVWLWDRKPGWRVAMVLGLACVGLVQVSVSVRRISQDAYRNIYLPTTAYLRQHAVGKGTIMGSAELGFDLGFDADIVDDHRLGVISGKSPTYVVIDKNRYAEWIETLATLEPEHYRSVRALMENFHLVADYNAYKIYARKGI